MTIPSSNSSPWGHLNNNLQSAPSTEELPLKPYVNASTDQEQYKKKLIDYKPPSLVREAVGGWKDACVSISFISPLSTAVVATLLQLTGEDAQSNVLETIFYTSIILNLGATTCAVLCLFILSDFTNKARSIAANDRDSLPNQFLLDEMSIYDYVVRGREREILREFGLGWSWSIAKATMIHCFLLGTICTFSGMGFWVWYQCASHVAGLVTIVLSLVSGASGFVLLLLMTGK